MVYQENHIYNFDIISLFSL